MENKKKVTVVRAQMTTHYCFICRAEQNFGKGQ